MVRHPCLLILGFLAVSLHRTRKVEPVPPWKSLGEMVVSIHPVWQRANPQQGHLPHFARAQYIDCGSCEIFSTLC